MVVKSLVYGVKVQAWSSFTLLTQTVCLSGSNPQRIMKHSATKTMNSKLFLFFWSTQKQGNRNFCAWKQSKKSLKKFELLESFSACRTSSPLPLPQSLLFQPDYFPVGWDFPANYRVLDQETPLPKYWHAGILVDAPSFRGYTDNVACDSDPTMSNLWPPVRWNHLFVNKDAMRKTFFLASNHKNKYSGWQ